MTKTTLFAAVITVGLGGLAHCDPRLASAAANPGPALKVEYRLEGASTGEETLWVRGEDRHVDIRFQKPPLHVANIYNASSKTLYVVDYHKHTAIALTFGSQPQPAARPPADRREVYLGRACDVFVSDVGETWTWKGLMLRQTQRAAAGGTLLNATGVTEAPHLPDGLFYLPAGIRLVAVDGEPVPTEAPGFAR